MLHYLMVRETSIENNIYLLVSAIDLNRHSSLRRRFGVPVYVPNRQALFTNQNDHWVSSSAPNRRHLKHRAQQYLAPFFPDLNSSQ